MNIYVHNEAKQEVDQLMNAIRNGKMELKRATVKSRRIREGIIDAYYLRLGELVEAGLIAFIDK